jgi:hypothetical protein
MRMSQMVPLIFMLGIPVALWLAWRSRTKVRDSEEDVCRVCGYDLRASQQRCPECGTPFRRPSEHFPLRDDWPADAITPRTPNPSETATCIHVTDIQWEARALREQLEVRGIAAQMLDRPIIADVGCPQYVGRSMGGWRVVVWSADAELAAAIRDRLIPRPREGAGA